MTTEPHTPQPAPEYIRSHNPFRFLRSEDTQSARQIVDTKQEDVEKQSSPSEIEEEESLDELLDLNYYQLVDEVWHFTSTDRGEKCRWAFPVLLV